MSRFVGLAALLSCAAASAIAPRLLAEPESGVPESVPYSLAWLSLLVLRGAEHATNIAIDSEDKLFICGYTDGDLGGQANAGDEDAFVAKYKEDGTLRWVVLIGSEKNDYANAIDTDSDDHAFVVGHTEGNLNGETSNGHADVFLARVETTGKLDWVVLLGGRDNDFGRSIIIDHVYIKKCKS